MKGELVFFSQYKLGGVQNYYKQIISQDAERQFVKKWLLTKDINDPAALPPAPFGVTDETVFEYSSADDVTKQNLVKLVPRGDGLVMTNFHLELDALSKFYRGKKTVVHVCHDDFFLGIARDYAFFIDAFVAHNYAYYTRLCELFPSRKQDIYFLPYGIAPSPYTRVHNAQEPLKVLFLARFDKKKGPFDLFTIDDILRRNGVAVQWTLIGDGPEKDALRALVNERANFSMNTLKDSDAVFQEAARQDVFILPSYLDGLPVALLETMSAGLVPVISAFNDGIQKVVDNEVGYIVGVGDNYAFAERLMFLHANRGLLTEIGLRAQAKVRKEYDIVSRAKDYYAFFGRFRELKRSIQYKYDQHIGGNKLQYVKFILGRALKGI